MAKKISAFACLECSTKSKEGVREIFESATKAALHAGLYLHTFFDKLLWLAFALRMSRKRD